MAGDARILGAVLAGGRSARMGRDKRGVLVDGRSLLARTVDALRSVVSEVVLVGGSELDDHLDVAADRRVPDPFPGGGPLAGLCAALREGTRTGADAVLVVGVDHPWLVPAVLRALVGHLLEPAADAPAAPPGDVAGTGAPDAAMLATSRGPQPLLAAYRPARSLAAVEPLLADGERRLHVVSDHLAVHAVAPSTWRALDPIGATAVDVDTPDELAAAERWWWRADATRAVRDGPPGVDVRGVEVTEVAGGAVVPAERTLIGEEPLEIRAAGPQQSPVTLMTTLRTPGHERELAAGWLVTEGVATPTQVVDVQLGDPTALARPDDTVVVRLRTPVDADRIAHRHAMATASCGVCGRASIDELADRVAPVSGDPFGPTPLPWDVVASLPDLLLHAQGRFRSTGGVHATGLFDAGGRLVTVREDVGRHNALDAAIGAHVVAGVWPDAGLDDLVCVLSGRVGFELVAKAAAARLPVVAAVGAPTDLAVRAAERLGITLVGFVRDGDGTVYAHPHRLDLAAVGRSSAGSRARTVECRETT